MKKQIVLAGIFSLFVLAMSAWAQTTSFAGTWTLDVSKSKLGDRNTIESQTMTVVPTATDIKVELTTKRIALPAAVDAWAAA